MSNSLELSVASSGQGGGVAHLVSGNKFRESRVDKIGSAGVNSIVERICGINPATVGQKGAGRKQPQVSEHGPFDKPETSENSFRLEPEESGMLMGAGPSATIAATYGDRAEAIHRGQAGNSALAQAQNEIVRLNQRIATLEAKLSMKNEIFNAYDNDVVDRVPLSKATMPDPTGASTVFSRGTKSKQTKNQKKPKQEAAMSVNILGLSTNEWRQMAGLSEPGTMVLETTDAPFEDQDETDEVQEAKSPDLGTAMTANKNYPVPVRKGNMVKGSGSHAPKTITKEDEDELWASFIAPLGFTPKSIAEFVEMAKATNDSAAISAISKLEDDFEASLEAGEGTLDEQWAAWLAERELSVELFDQLVEMAETEEQFAELEQLQAQFEAGLKVAA